MTQPNFRWTHFIDGRAVDFPHLCPGDGCAVEKWCAEKLAREQYEALPGVLGRPEKGQANA